MIRMKDLEEIAALEIADYAICVHIVTSAFDIRRFKPDGMQEYESDILSYAFAAEPPFKTVIADRRENVTVVFPSKIPIWTDSGERVEVVCPPERRERLVQVTAAATLFKESQICVLHIIFRPLPGEARSLLNEWEVIKLSKLWIGGEGVPEPGTTDEADQSQKGRWISFRLQDEARSRSFDDFAAVLFGSPGLIAPTSPNGSVREPSRRLSVTRTAYLSGVRSRSGTVQIKPSEPSSVLEARISKLILGEDDRLEGPELAEMVAWGGILQGLLDFREIGYDDLGDVFRSFSFGESAPTGFHKGTLVSIGAPSRSSPIGISPYLALPHAVLIHNEECSRLARACAPSPTHGGKGHRYSISEYGKRLDYERWIAGCYIPNPFHYKHEQEIYQVGHIQRGADHIRNRTTARIGQETTQRDDRIKRRDLVLVLSGIILAVLAGAQTAFARAEDIIPFYAVPSLAIVLLLAAAYLVFRRM